MPHLAGRLVMLFAEALGTLPLGGCSTLFGRRTQKLTVTSNLPGAHVYVAGADSGTTPRTMRIRRGKAPLVLRVQRDSADAVTQTLKRGVSSWGLFFNAMYGLYTFVGLSFGAGPSDVVVGGVFAFALATSIDVASGKLFLLKTDSVHVTLPVRPPTRP